MALSIFTRRLAVLAIASISVVLPRLSADVISYEATSFTTTATLGSTTMGSCPVNNPVCIHVSIYFLADTANIVSFSVPGASGYENFVGQGRVLLFNNSTGDTLTANFADNQIYVSVDQTNQGIGFGSALGGPTYPLGIYGGTPSSSYSTYDLSTAFSVSGGFAWFCPPGTCTFGQAGPGLQTDQGLLTITPSGLSTASFTASVVEVTTPVPEPSSVLLVASGIGTLVLRRKSRRHS